MVSVDFNRVLRPYDQEAEIIAVGDTFTVSRKGFVVFRFKANNPGPWLLHCHMEWHIDPGLVLVFSVLAYPTYSQSKQQWKNYVPSDGASIAVQKVTSGWGIFSLLLRHS